MSGLRFQELVNMSRDGYGRLPFHHQKTEKGEEIMDDAYTKIFATTALVVDNRESTLQQALSNRTPNEDASR